MTAQAALLPAVADAQFIAALEAYRQAIIESGQRCFAFGATDGVVDPQRAFEYELLGACRALPGGLPDDVLIVITNVTSPDPEDPVEAARKEAIAARAAGAAAAPNEYPTATCTPERVLEAAKAAPVDPSAGRSSQLHRQPLSGGGGRRESQLYGPAGPFAHPSATDRLPALLAETGFGLRRDGAAWLLTASDGTVIGRGDLTECTRLAHKFGCAES